MVVIESVTEKKITAWASSSSVAMDTLKLKMSVLKPVCVCVCVCSHLLSNTF